jgi:ABC-2 type transport system ATP-binding protein
VAVIDVQNLSKVYLDGTEAVNGITFQVEKGEIFGLLGPNGAGKTTTMKILGTLHSHTSGTASVLGFDVAKEAKEIRARIGFAMQEVGMDELATAHEMLMFHARLAKMPKAEAKARAAELLKTFDLEAHANRRVTRFSGGMQRRLDLAVSLIHTPEVLFLDEPSTGLDPKSRSDLWAILRRLRRDNGLTIVLSTHYMEEADELCDRIAIIADGKLVAIDTPGALKRSVGRDTILVDIANMAQGSETKLRATFKSAMQMQGQQLAIQARDGAAQLLPALKVIDAAGCKVVSTHVKSPTLDDAFLKYTGQRLQEEE